MILFWLSFTLFERSWTIRGMEKVLTDFYFRKKEINYLLDGITEFNIEIAKKALKSGYIDGFRTGDDFGTQKGMLMSPAMWRGLFKDRYKRIWAVFKEKDLPIFHHSCGNIMEILPDLIEIGLDVLTPIQSEALDINELSSKYGKHLSFMGGISTQNTLPFGTPQQVMEEIREKIKILGKNNGYIIASSHQITTDCKSENFLMLLKTLNEYKRDSLII